MPVGSERAEDQVAVGVGYRCYRTRCRGGGRVRISRSRLSLLASHPLGRADASRPAGSSFYAANQQQVVFARMPGLRARTSRLVTKSVVASPCGNASAIFR